MIDRDALIRKLRPTLIKVVPGLTERQATEILVTCSPQQRWAFYQIVRAARYLKSRKRDKAYNVVANVLRPRENPIVRPLAEMAWSKPR